MSTSEKWTNPYPCPCGGGHLLEHVDSPDNPWSRTTRKYELACEPCATNWTVVDDELRSRSAYEALLNAHSRKREVEGELKSLGQVLIDHVVGAGRFSEPKDEYRFLKEAGVCLEGPIRFKRARERGIFPGKMCNPLLGIDWLLGQLPAGADAARMNELNALRTQLEAQLITARAEMKTIQVVSLFRANPPSTSGLA